MADYRDKAGNWEELPDDGHIPEGEEFSEGSDYAGLHSFDKESKLPDLDEVDPDIVEKMAREAQKKARKVQQNRRDAAAATVRLRKGLAQNQSGANPHPKEIIGTHLETSNPFTNGKETSPVYTPRLKALRKEHADVTSELERLNTQHLDNASDLEAEINNQRILKNSGMGIDPTGAARIRRASARYNASKAAVQRKTAMQKRIEASIAREASTAQATKQPVSASNQEEYRQLLKLRKRSIAAAAKGKELDDTDKIALWNLEDKYKDYKPVVTTVKGPGGRQMLPNEARDQSIKDKLHDDYNTDVFPDRFKAGGKSYVIQSETGLRPQTSVEEEIGFHGQEDPSLKIGEGWKATSRFNVEQKKRLINAHRTGEATIFNRGGLKLGANQEQIVDTVNWSPVNPPKDDKTHDTFTFTLKHNGKQQGWNDEGEYQTEGRDIEETLRKSSIRSKLTKRTPIAEEPSDELESMERKGNTITVKTAPGVHLNPDEVSELHQTLIAHHGVDAFHAEVPQGFTRERYIQDLDANPLPRGVKDTEVSPTSHRQAKLSKTAQMKWGERDAASGEFLPGQGDRVGVKLGQKRALTYQFNEDTDYLDWRRPGSKNVSSAVLAMPRAARDRQIYEAYHSPSGEENLDRMVRQEHPELETDAEREQEKSKLRKHAKDLAAAGFATTVYNTRDKAPKDIVRKTYKRAQQSRFGEQVNAVGVRTNLDTHMGNFRWGVQKPLTTRMEKTANRVKHPLGGEEGGIDLVREFNHLKPVRYRSWGVGQENYYGRLAEKEVIPLTKARKARESIEEFMASSSRNPYRKLQARSAVHDPMKRVSDQLVADAEAKHDEIESLLKRSHVDMGTRTLKWEDAPTYRAYLEKAQADLKEIIDRRGALSHDVLEEGWDAYKDHIKDLPPSQLKRVAKVTGKAGGIGMLATGVGVLGVDAYQTHEARKGKTVNHPVISRVPETVKVPTAKVKTVSRYKIPSTELSRALDLDNQRVITGAKVSTGTKSIRIHGRRDVSGELYRNDGPLLGGISARTPKNQVNVGRSLFRASPRSNLGNTQNPYVVGKRIPIDVSVGRQERWGEGRNKLSRSNPNRLSPEDRDAALRMATARRTAQSPSPQYTDKELEVRNMYGSDPVFASMLTDQDAINRAWKKYDDPRIYNLEDARAKKKNNHPSLNTDLESYNEQRRAQHRMDRESRNRYES